MKRCARFGLPALLLALILASCGGPAQNADRGAAGEGTSPGTREEPTARPGETTGSMDHGSATGMVMEDGEYSDERFIDAMIPHHRGAVQMARVALNNAEHQEIRDLARNIISSQKAEIRELRDIRKEEFGNAGMRMGPEESQMMGMTMSPRELARQKPFDKAFIDAMIPHHQSAIEMAEVARQESENPRIRKLAQNIVSAQEREISQMQEWRREWYPQG